MTDPQHPDWSPQDAADAREFMRERMARRCVLRGEFQLAGGAAAGVYFDCKRVTLDGLFLNELADWIVFEVLPRLPERPDLVGGPTLGADFIAAAVAMRAADEHDMFMEMLDQTPDDELRRAFDLDQRVDLDEFRELAEEFPQLPTRAAVVRREAKAHGTRSLIENEPDEEARILVVEDVITTGGSLARACDAFIAEGHKIAGIFALLDREAGGREMLEEKYGAPVLPLFKLSDFPEARAETT